MFHSYTWRYQQYGCLLHCSISNIMFVGQFEIWNYPCIKINTIKVMVFVFKFMNVTKLLWLSF